MTTPLPLNKNKHLPVRKLRLLKGIIIQTWTLETIDGNLNHSESVYVTSCVLMGDLI